MSWRRHAAAPVSLARPPRRPASSWSPPAAPSPVIPTLRRDLDARWSTDSRGHLVVYRPPCGVPGCALPSMTWARCPRCRKVLGRCYDHHAGDPVLELRAQHCAGGTP